MRKRFPRYTLSSHVDVYDYENNVVGETAVGKYTYNKPAHIQFKLDDAISGQALEFDFFPVQITHAEGTKGLSGHDPQEVLHRRTDRVHNRDLSGNVAAAEEMKEGRIPPHFELRLRDNEGKIISKLLGVQHENGDGAIALQLSTPSFPTISTELPLPQMPQKRDEVQRVLDSNIPLKGLIDGFSEVSVKPFEKPNFVPGKRTVKTA